MNYNDRWDPEYAGWVKETEDNLDALHQELDNIDVKGVRMPLDKLVRIKNLIAESRRIAEEDVPARYGQHVLPLFDQMQARLSRYDRTVQVLN